jgi:hypothetical protein
MKPHHGPKHSPEPPREHESDEAPDGGRPADDPAPPANPKPRREPPAKTPPVEEPGKPAPKKRARARLR